MEEGSGSEINDGVAGGLDWFEEPQDFHAPEKPATFTEYTLREGGILSLRLVGHSPLWVRPTHHPVESKLTQLIKGHLLWNAGKIVAKYLEDNVDIVKGKNVLELGAGAGLPSLVAAHIGACKVVVTDYPDADLIYNLQYNIDHNSVHLQNSNIVAEGYLWGDDIGRLVAHLRSDVENFDTLVLADILFNHSEHKKLVSTVKTALSKLASARALVFFTPYRPWLLEKDEKFFELAQDAGFVVSKLFEHTMEQVMFDDDPGDERLRRTVFAYELCWRPEMQLRG